MMPNHVHVLIETLPGYPLGDVVQSWKTVTAREANQLLNRTGSFWRLIILTDMCGMSGIWPQCGPISARTRSRRGCARLLRSGDGGVRGLSLIHI
jgi:hypothetical protein